jgi:catalase (peroxidase I)
MAAGGPEITWSQTPIKWSNHFFDNLFNNEWELTKSPTGAYQWKAKGAAATIPDAHVTPLYTCAVNFMSTVGSSTSGSAPIVIWKMPGQQSA